MDYKKKYKNALGMAEEIIRYYKEHNRGDEAAIEDLEEIFPELGKSEDERIRKGIIELVKQSSEILDKQNQNNMIAWLEKQGKQKPTDKVEPKFHEGDWIIDKQGIVHQIEKVIENVTNNTFGYDLVGGGYFNEEVKSYRLWTIADAKDGNVLYSLDSNRPFIYKERNGYEQATAYCGLNIYGKFFVWNTKDCIITTDKYIPATKEQRDLLFKKIEEAGYQWDAKKKELKLLISNGGDFESNNSKQKPTWSEDDERIITALMEGFRYHQLFNPRFGEVPNAEIISWIKSLKERLS